MMNRGEHLAWCKQRALEYLAHNDQKNAVTSMLSDLSKHPETKKVGETMGLLGIHLLRTPHSNDEIRKFIEGFN